MNTYSLNVYMTTGQCFYIYYDCEANNYYDVITDFYSRYHTESQLNVIVCKGRKTNLPIALDFDKIVAVELVND